ncbi:MAG TPA: hypothetical protein VK364_14150, partial [Hymenobacter sp.]|nr:hypothetical protein [Hymenobacter sp.]
MMFYVLLLACSLLGLSLVAAAWRRPNRRHRLARLVASLVAVAALWLTAYPPQRATQVPRNEAILLTAGYQPDSLTALLRRLGPATRLWHYAPNSAFPPPDTPTIARLGALREQYPALERVHLLGYGLPAAALPELGPLRLVWHKPPSFNGFHAAQWNRTLELGQPLLLEGYFSGPAGRAVWVRLQATGTTQDSVRLPTGRGTFRLRYTPKVTGRVVATLSAGPLNQLLAAEPVPAEVLPPTPLRVLLVAATPSFELKFLKNHLADRQHAVAWRAGISRGLTQTEFSNQPAVDLSRLTPALLSRYDIVVADASSLASLSSSETQALRAAQRTTGLGLILLAEVSVSPKAIPSAPTIQVVPQQVPEATRSQRLAWPAAATIVPATLRLSGTARALITTTNGAHPVVAAQRTGLGTMVVSVLSETYPWLLQSATSLYENYWSRLLSAAARPTSYTSRWTVTDAWPRPEMPLILRLTAASSSSSLPTAATGQLIARMPLLQDSRLPEWSTATFWPTKAGWHQVQRPGQAAQWFYVFDHSAWQGPEV